MPPSMRAERSYWVYILASDVGGTLYIGVTNNLVRRVYEHRTEAAEGFTSKYEVSRLVYYEQFSDIENAIRHDVLSDSAVVTGSSGQAGR